MIILVDKPKGITSFDVIRRLRTELGIKKMGHAGTLDPLASGLLIVATEGDTKKLSEFLKLPKTYEVAIRLGERRDTGDLEGAIVEAIEVPTLDEERIKEVATSLVGTHMLSVPLYSAIKVAGKPLYKYAREGKGVEVPVKEMTVRDVRYNGTERGDGVYAVYLTLDVESGVYIRSLAEEFGRRLGYPATTASLRRTKIGDYKVEDAKK